MKSRYLLFPIGVLLLALLLLRCKFGLPSPTGFPTMLTATPESSLISMPVPIGGGTGWVGYVSLRDDNYDLYMMKVDGSEEIRLTDDPAMGKGILFSPDGSKIAFDTDRDGKKLIMVSERDGNHEVYILPLDGSDLICLTNSPQEDFCAMGWSPNGLIIAFYSARRKS